MSPRAAPPAIRVRIEDLEATIKALVQSGSSFEEAVKSVTESHAHTIQQTLRQETDFAYTKGTGRFSRGIKTRVSHEITDDSVTSRIIVTLPGYRETRFLTDIGGSGKFKVFPVAGYYIFAKGVGRLFDAQAVGDSIKGAEAQRYVKLARKRARSRLKVPVGHKTFRLLSAAPAGKRLETKFEDTAFFYPLWVRHPGFPQDVVGDVLTREEFDYTQEMVDKTTGEMAKVIARQQTLSFSRSTRPFGITVDPRSGAVGLARSTVSRQ